MNIGSEQMIAELIPKNIDELITQRRDQFSLRWANENEFTNFPPIVSLMGEQKQIKETLNEWRIFCYTTPTEHAYLLTGFKRSTGSPLLTSIIQAVDFEQNIVLTQSSLYRLGTKGEGENIRLLLHICCSYHSWGIGETLGMLPVFY